MPGILPMKVIKVGTSAQSRIAQACDRCRSKKIRCDGITPCCSQCATVGFECKTSDKLSRRAFPRGYTESLEERVRALETEVKELKDLLDEKDEKIDILSRIHSNSPSPRRPSSTPSTSTSLGDSKNGIGASPPEEDTFRVRQFPSLFDGDQLNSCFMGASSGRSFIDMFKAKVQECGKSCSDFKTDMFFAQTGKETLTPKRDPAPTTPKLPPRMASDQMINIYLQEWAPLFPVLHRPTLLRVYAEYGANPDDIKDKHSIAQLNMIFGIAALSAQLNIEDSEDFESQWQIALDSVLEENTLPTLQCLVLAQIFCIAKADFDKLLHYKGMAISLSHRLGLHQSQNRFSLGALTSETRKKVFWTLYTLDCFSAAFLGLPKLLKEDDIHAEYPANINDKNVSERGFQSTLPDESTRASSALALFRLARILSRVLDENYPTASSHDLSLQKINALDDELNVWLKGLPPHLRLQFVQDKPSTNVIGSRSPFLSLAYHYIRNLIHRPAVGSSLGNRASPSVVALAQSSKHIVQILQLLEERRMSFTFCLNKNEILLLAGFGLLFQALTLDRKGKLMQDIQRLLCSVVDLLERNSATGASEFKKVACTMISVDRFSKKARALEDSGTRRKSDGMPAPKGGSKSARRLQAIASRFSSTSTPPIKHEHIAERRSTAPSLPTDVCLYARRDSQNSASSVLSDPLHQSRTSNPTVFSRYLHQVANPLNLDYLSFNEDSTPSPQRVSAAVSAKHFGNHGLGRSQSCVSPFQAQPPPDSLFPSHDILSSYMTPSPTLYDWCPDVWNISSDLTPDQAALAHSRFSVSEEELTSGEEFSSCGGDLKGLTLPNVDGIMGLDGLDGTFGL